MKFAVALASLATVAALAAGPAFAANEHDAHHAAAPAAAGAADAVADGTVKKVDKAAGKITISHGPLVTLDMPPMTMVFRASDPAMVDKVKAGDKIRFTADRVGGVFTVTTLELAQ